MAAIQILQPYKIKKLYRDLANIFCKYIVKSKGINNVIVVLIEVDTQLSCHTQPDMKISDSQESFEKDKIKENLAKFCAMFLAKNAHILIYKDTSIKGGNNIEGNIEGNLQVLHIK